MTLPRVLVIDDDEIVRELMCEILRHSGCEVIGTGSPIGVTKLITQHRIDVVVLDVMMPDISGDKLAKLLRSNPKLRELAIVLVSSDKQEHLAQIAAEVSADSVLTKADVRTQLSLVVLSTHRRRALSRSMGQ